MSHKIGKEATPVCPLCKHPDATAEHILLHCPSRKLSTARKQLEKTLMDKLHVNTHQYNQPHLQSKHPIEEIPNSKLYPYTTNLHHEQPVQIVNGLSESRWYHKSESKKLRHDYNTTPRAERRRTHQTKENTNLELLDAHRLA